MTALLWQLVSRLKNIFLLNSSIPSMNSLRSVRDLKAPSRIATHIHSQARHFHPTKPAPFINEVLDISAGFIHGVHDVTGLPWAASIPLTALLVRTAVGFPLQIYTRSTARREREIMPLLNSWRVYWTRRAQKEAKGKTVFDALMVNRELKGRSNFLRRRWNVNRGYRLVNFLQLPVWLSLMESLRGMCGSNNGLVSRLLSSIEGSETAADSLHLTVEPSLASEGALWFPDLLAGDPSGTLPLLLTTSIILNVRNGWNVTPWHELADKPKSQLFLGLFFRGLRVLIQGLAINLGYMAFAHDMPAALMIYWITSTNAATLQTYFLEKYMFVRPPIPPYVQKFVVYNNRKVSDPFKTRMR